MVDQPATIGALAVAVAQETGITVSYLPGLSMRRIADLTPGSAKTDAKDAAVIAGAARTMPHTLRAISTSDEDAAALSMLTGFDLDLARQVNQTANRIRGLYTQIHPALETVVGPWLEHDSVLEARRRPAPPQPTRRARARQASTPGSRSTGAGGTPPGQPRSARPWSTRPWWSPAPTPPQWFCPTWPGSSSPCTLSGPMSPPRSRPWCRPTLMCQVLTTRARDQGSRPPPSLLAQTPTRTSSHRSPAGLLRRPGTGDQKIRLIDPRRARLPWRQQAAQTRHVRLRPSPPYNSDPVSRAYYQRKPGQGKRLGPSRPRPGPPPHPDPAHHDPQRHPLRPTTNHETTHRHLTHHTGTPPGGGDVLEFDPGRADERAQGIQGDHFILIAANNPTGNVRFRRMLLDEAQVGPLEHSTRCADRSLCLRTRSSRAQVSRR